MATALLTSDASKSNSNGGVGAGPLTLARRLPGMRPAQASIVRTPTDRSVALARYRAFSEYERLPNADRAEP